MAELEPALPCPPNKNASPWISIMEDPKRSFGNAGPNVSKIENSYNKVMLLHVGQFALKQIKYVDFLH
jgi:hypothetical protein